MNPQVKEKWIKALRSGEYQQGKYKLRNQDNQYCCLGVLCDLYSKEHNQEWKYFEKYGGVLTSPRAKWYFEGESEGLPLNVMKWAELKLNDPYINTGHYEYELSLSTLNDAGHSFNEVADIIENQL